MADRSPWSPASPAPSRDGRGAPASVVGVPSPRLERAVLAAPDAVARRAARVAPDAEARWILRQPRAVRRSFAEEVFGRADRELREQAWLLRQPDAVRHSFVREVLSPGLG